MRRLVVPLVLCVAATARFSSGQAPAVKPPSAALLQVKRVFVAELTGGPGADALRSLIITSLDATKLFVLTDNPERADAILKGAADDHPFVDTFDSEESLSTHTNSGKNSGGSTYSKSSSLYRGISVGESEGHHIRERKHEAYATVRLCNRDGDVLWSTTQESLGAKFRGASADVAYKIATQLSVDVERVQQGTAAASAKTAVAGAAVKP